MLKFIFWTLLGLNAVLFAYGQGMLGNFKASEREPARLKNQINTDKLLLRGAPTANLTPVLLPVLPTALAPVLPPAAAAAAAPATVLIACTEVGNFAASDARRFERLVAPLALGQRQSQREVAVQEITSYMVMIPPLGSKDAADKKAADLKAQGVTNFFIMNETAPTKWAISLGVFKAETAAQTLMAELKKQGVTGAKVAGRTSAGTRLAYRIIDIDAETRAKLDGIAAALSADLRTCK